MSSHSQRGRREILKLLGAGLAAVPLLSLLDCAGDGLQNTGGSSGGTTGGSSGSGSTGGSTTGSGSTAGSSGGSSGSTGGATTWATGGTAAMTGKASYPNPFAALSTCARSCELTEGPCYDQAAPTREDISEGQDGLPVRLAFQLLDADCNPVTDATIDVWHCNPLGVYSGDDSANEDVAFCTGNDATAEAALWFRGRGATDASGQVFFDTCFPGWYSSRTIHVHFTIRRGSDAYLTSQLFFDDALDDEVCTTQPVYAPHGAPDTTNETDTVITADQVAGYTFTTARMGDGAMLASKQIVIRSSLSDSSCAVSGSGGSGGGGGGPTLPDGGMPPHP